MASYLNYKIQEFVIESLEKKSVSIDASGAVASIKYFEDLFSPAIFISVLIVNSDGLLSGIPIRGGERVRLKIYQPATDEYIFIDETKNPYYIYKVSSTSQSTREALLLELAPSEIFTNETSRVFKRYPETEGSIERISDSVGKILKDVLKTTKKNDIESSMNSYSFFGNSKKPFTVLTWLCPKAIPTNGSSSATSGTAGFLFYENKNGYNFKSVDGLITGLKYSSGDKKNYVTYFYTESNDTPASSSENFKILGVPAFDKNVNVMENLRVGMYSSVNYFYDINTRVPSVYNYKLSESYNIMNHASSSNNTPKIPQGLENYPSRLMVKITDSLVKNSIDGDPNKTPDNRIKYQSQSVARYNLAFSQTLNITVPLNLKLTVGDVIELNIGKITKGTKEKDIEKSGLYLIKELAHSFDDNYGYTGLRLVRDSYGRPQ